LEMSFYLGLSWDDSSCRGAHAMIGIGRVNLRRSNSYQYLKREKICWWVNLILYYGKEGIKIFIVRFYLFWFLRFASSHFWGNTESR
jgi:hypothetical protein